MIITNHFGYKISELSIIGYFNDLSLADIPDILNYLFILLLGCYYFLLFASQKSISDESQIKDNILFIFFGCKISLCLIVILKLQILCSHTISNNMFFLCWLNSQKYLKMDNFKRITMKINPLWQNCCIRMKNLYFLYPRQQIIKYLIETFFRDFFDRIAKRQRISGWFLKDNIVFPFMFQYLCHFGEYFAFVHQLYVLMCQHRIPTKLCLDSLHQNCLCCRSIKRTIDGALWRF